MSLGIAEIASHDGMPSSVPWDLSRGGIEQVESRRYWRPEPRLQYRQALLYGTYHTTVSRLVRSQGRRVSRHVRSQGSGRSRLVRSQGSEASRHVRSQGCDKGGAVFKTGFSATEVQQDLVRRELV